MCHKRVYYLTTKVCNTMSIVQVVPRKDASQRGAGLYPNRVKRPREKWILMQPILDLSQGKSSHSHLPADFIRSFSLFSKSLTYGYTTAGHTSKEAAEAAPVLFRVSQTED